MLEFIPLQQLQMMASKEFKMTVTKQFRMTQWKKLNADFISARKNKDKELSNALLMLVDGTTKLAKENLEQPTDKHLLMFCKSYLKRLVKAKELGVENQFEIELTKSFLPQTMSEEETKEFVEMTVKMIDKPNIGSVMKALKASGKSLDFKLANRFVRDLI